MRTPLTIGCAAAAVAGLSVQARAAGNYNVLLYKTEVGQQRQYCSRGSVVVKDRDGNKVVEFSQICVDVVDRDVESNHTVEARLGGTQVYSTGHFAASANDMHVHVLMNMIGQPAAPIYEIDMGYYQRLCPSNQPFLLVASTPVQAHVPIMPNAGDTARLVFDWPSGDPNDVTCRPEER